MQCLQESLELQERTSTAEVKEKNSTRTEYTKPTSSTLYTNESTTEWGEKEEGKKKNNNTKPNMTLNKKNSALTAKELEVSAEHH